MWPESVWGGEEIDVLVHDEDHEAVARASVAVDDDPEEAVGRETVGRTRRDRNEDSRPGRVSEEFATVLEEFESAVSEPAELLRITVFILRAQRSVYRLGPFFLECWQVSLNFLRLVPIQLGRGEQVYSPTLSTRPHPTPQLTKNFGKVGANVENNFSSSAWQLFSSWKPVQKLSYSVNFFTPDSLVTHHLCVCQLPRRYRFIQEKCQNDLLFILPPFPFRK